MANKPLIRLITDLIQRQNKSVAPVKNLLGAPPIGLANPLTEGAPQHWKVYNLLGTYGAIVPLSPDAIINQLSTVQLISAPFLDGVNGAVTFNTVPGTTMLTTIVNLLQPIPLAVTVDAPGCQIALYVHETLISRGNNNLNTIVNMSAGNTPLNIVTQGTILNQATVTIPSDITTDVSAFIPPTPLWLQSGTINADYVDPLTQTLGVELLWNNQSNVGGWDIYRVNTTDYGTIQTCSTVGGKYRIQTNYSGIVGLPFIGTIGIVSGSYIGNLEQATYNSTDNSSYFTFAPYDQGSSILSGELNILSFAPIANVPKTSNDNIITFVDHNVQQSGQYSYTLDAYSVVDSLLRSDKAQILTINTPSIPGIGSASLIETTPGYLTLFLSGFDTQVKYWSAWIRKNNWPTVDGTADAAPYNDYIKFKDESVSITTYTFSAGVGTWYAIVVPFDSHNNPGFEAACSGTVTGSIGGGGGAGSAIPYLTTTGISIVNDALAIRPVNKVWWQTNQAGERPDSANGSILVEIIAQNSWTGESVNITSGTRLIWQDWEDHNSNINDTSNTRLLYGSIVDLYNPVYQAPSNPSKPNQPHWATINYTINVLSGVSNFGTYQLSISDYYGPPGTLA